MSRHHIATLAGMSMEAGLYEWVDLGTGRNFSNESEALRYDNNAGSFPNHPSGSADDYALQSYFGRAAYEFADKYLVDTNIRDDASSKFASNNR